MAQKVNPVGLRLGINRTWDSRWYANRGAYAQMLHQDIEILLEHLPDRGPRFERGGHQPFEKAGALGGIGEVGHAMGALRAR